MANDEILSVSKDSEDSPKRVVFEIDENMAARFKGACGVRKLSMKEVIEEFMKKYVDETFHEGGDNKKG